MGVHHSGGDFRRAQAFAETFRRTAVGDAACVRRTLVRRVRSAAEFVTASGRAAILAAMLASVLAATPAAGAPSDLADAVRRGDAAAIRKLLAAGSPAAAAIDQADAVGMTPLLWAAQANDEGVASLLLAAGADPNLANRYGISPLWLAATNRSAALVALLLERGADARATSPHGETALMAAARAGDVDSIRALLAAGADPNASESSSGETALMWAAGENHADAVRVLVAGGADPNAHARVLNLPAMNWVQTGMVSTALPVGGWTALMYAARDDKQDAALALVASGADPNAQDPDGTTALALAVMNAHYDLAAALLDAGADPNVADRTGATPLYFAVDMVTLGREIGRPERPLLDERDARDLLRELLAHGADPNARLAAPAIERHHGFPDRSLGEGTTALMRAAKSHDLESMRWLLDAGADATLVQADGSGVLFSAVGPPPRGVPPDAAAQAAKDTLALLVNAGADLHAANSNGETALHRAARQGSAIAVTWLVEQGVPVDVRDGMGRTPLDFVSQPGRFANPQMASLLKQLGGELMPEDTSAIEALSAGYARALGACDAQAYADLFVPVGGYFASGFRGHLFGRERLAALVESERHCTGAAASGARPGGNVPAVAIEGNVNRARGVVDLGAVGQYQDEYVKTPEGWKFASRTVVLASERDAGLDAAGMLAIRRLSGDELVDRYFTDPDRVGRLRSSGVVIAVVDGKVTGRAYLSDGSHYEDVYAKTADGAWRFESRVHVPAVPPADAPAQ